MSATQPKRRKGPKPRPFAERFWGKVARSEEAECWLWTAGQYSNGYGLFNIRFGKTALAHRVAYELERGQIPDGLQLDHLCRNRLCCNPAHLEPVTLRVNLLRGDTVTAHHAAKTHCLNGHPFDLFNTHIRPNGSRHCRECARLAERKRRGVE